MKTEEQGKMITDWLEKNGNPEIMKQVEKEAEELELQHYSEEYANCNTINDEFSLLKNAFIAGAEWKKERYINDVNSQSWGFENFEIIKTDEDAKIFVENMENIPEPNDKLKKAFRDFKKQETIEEIAEKFYYEQSKSYEDEVEPIFDNSRYLITGFISGYKLAQQQMYSQEEVINFIRIFDKDFNLGIVEKNKGINNWFDQFKKK